MSKRSSKKSKRRSKAVVPALGITGLSLSLASGATASTGEAADALTSQPHQLFLGEEEIFDTSLSTFFTFDKENGEQTSHAQDLKLAKGGGCGCGGGGGGCGGGGKGCGGTCWIWTPTWGWINTCWSESTPAGEETRVASEQIEQTAIAEEKK
jgi:hypothetical protein